MYDVADQDWPAGEPGSVVPEERFRRGHVVG